VSEQKKLSLDAPEVERMARALYKTFWGHEPAQFHDIHWLAVGRHALEAGAVAPASKSTNHRP
jgi:hypothetical protein